MGAELVLASTTLSGAGDATATFRLALSEGRTKCLQIDTDGTLVIGAVVLEVRNSHPDAVNGGGWIDVTSILADGLRGDDLTAGQGAAAYNFSFEGSEEMRLTVPWASGSGDVSATLHAVT